MLKKKWNTLLLRKKLLIISGICVILSIPFILLTIYILIITVTVFICLVVYNFYKSIMDDCNLSSSDGKSDNIEKKLKETSYTFDGKTVFLIQKYAFGFMMENQKGDWDKFVKCLTENSINLYCTYNSMENFVDYILATGHIDDFIFYLLNFCKLFPANMYNLDEAGEISIVRIE